MEQINSTTFKQDADKLEVVVGDEKQKDFYPRVKLKKWDNEVNFSVGLKSSSKKHKITKKDDTIIWKGDYEARFYPLSESKRPKPTAIRRVIKQQVLEPYESSAEYEYMRHRNDKSLSVIDIATYTTKPMLMHFDSMPTGRYTEVDDSGMATDFDHKDKSGYQPADLPIPKVGKIPANRIYSPYTESANPYYSDEGLVFIDIQYGWAKVPNIENIWCDAIIEVLKKHGIKVTRPTERTKLYFEHKGRQVKFHSAENARGALVAYINLNCMYNKAYDYYKPDVKQDVRDKYAYGLQQAYPEISYDLIDDIIKQFAKKLSLPIDDKEYTKEEWQDIKSIIPKHKDIGWIRDAKRKDADWFYSDHKNGFEFEFDLKEKPKTNVFDLSIKTKGLTFYKQEPLTQKELEEGYHRDPDIVGSYAVYHQDGKRDNQYETGKAFHIYRPIAKDAKGSTYFCDMDIDEDKEVLRLTVPQDFLDSATYPITVDPTFGYLSGGGSSASALGVIKGTVQTATESGTLESISAYIDTSDSTATQHEGAVYRSSDGVLISQSSNDTGQYGSASWVSLSMSGSITATDYVLSYWGTASGGYSGGALNLYYDSTGGKTSKTKTQAYSADNWPTPITWDADETSRQYSIYVTYGVARYWVGGNGTWNATVGSKWSTSSGGAGGASVPTANNDVFFDAASGAATVTISGSRVCRSLNCTGFTGSLGGASTPVLSIGNADGGGLTLGSGMSMGSGVSLNFVSTSNNSGLGWPITCNGIYWYGSVTFDGVGGKWTLQDNFGQIFFGMTLTNGTLDTNNKNVDSVSLSSNNSNLRTLSLGTSTITLSQYNATPFWNLSTTTNLTFSGASSTIVFNDSAKIGITRSFEGGGLTYGTLTLTGDESTGVVAINGANTFNTLNVSAGRCVTFQSGVTQSISNWNVSGQIFRYQAKSLSSTETITTPHSAALQITGDITVMVRVQLANYAKFLTNQMLIAKRDSTNRTFHFNVNGNGLLFFATADTATTSSAGTTSTNPFTNGVTYWILATRKSSDGTVQFFKADGTIENPAATDFAQWDPDSSNTPGSIYPGTYQLEIGSADNGATQPTAGKFYRAKIYDGFFASTGSSGSRVGSAFVGTLQFDADFVNKPFGADSFTESSVNAATVTMNGTSKYGDGRIEINSSTPGSQHTLTTSGTKSSDFLKIQDSNASTGTWYAGSHSTNLGNNSRWIFETKDRGNFMQMM